MTSYVGRIAYTSPPIPLLFVGPNQNQSSSSNQPPKPCPILLPTCGNTYSIILCLPKKSPSTIIQQSPNKSVCTINYLTYFLICIAPSLEDKHLSEVVGNSALRANHKPSQNSFKLTMHTQTSATYEKFPRRSAAQTCGHDYLDQATHKQHEEAYAALKASKDSRRRQPHSHNHAARQKIQLDSKPGVTAWSQGTTAPCTMITLCYNRTP